MKTSVVTFLAVIWGLALGLPSVIYAQFPVITSIEPEYGVPGDEISIYGSNFVPGSTGNAVYFGSPTPALQTSQASTTRIKARVPDDAISGPIVVTTSGGSATSQTHFQVLNPGPYITSFSPLNAQAGETLTILGDNFTLYTRVIFSGDVEAAVTPNAQNKLFVTVPAGAQNGPITVWNPGGTPVPGSNVSDEDFTIVYPVDVGITMKAVEEQIAINRPFRYLLTVTNHSTVNTAQNVQVLDALSTTVGNISVSPSQGTSSINGRFVTVELGSLSKSTAATIEITSTPSTLGSITNSATLNALGDTNAGNNSALLVSQVVDIKADLGIGITANPLEARLGGQIDYFITVTNKGPQAATQVRVRDTFPASVSYFTIVDLPNGSAVESTSPELVVNVGNFALNETKSFKVIVLADSEGTALNTVTVSGNEDDPESVNDSASAEVTIASPAADLELTLTSSPETPVVGNGMEFLLTVKNLGPEAANNTETTFVLPSNFFYQSNTASQGPGSVISGSEIIAKFGQISPNAQATLRVTGLAQNTNTLTGSVQSAFSDEDDPDPSNNLPTLNLQPVIEPHPIEAGLSENGGLVLSWPTYPVENELQRASFITSEIWLPVETGVTSANGVNTITITPAATGAQYYQLRYQPSLP